MIAEYPARDTMFTDCRTGDDIQYIQVIADIYQRSAGFCRVLCYADCEPQTVSGQLIEQLVLKGLLGHQSEENQLSASPHFAAIIIGSIMWVTYSWITRLIRGELRRMGI